jgi:hypothetical protein
VTWTFERRLLGAAMLGWTAIAVVSLVTGPPLGHDEAAFAIVARGDAPAWLYRSRGVTLLAELGVALGGADWQLRLASALTGLAVIPAVFAVGRAVFDARTGAWAAAILAGAYPMVSRNAELLGDLPATAAVLAGLAILAGELGRADGPRRRLVLAAPAFAAAFYVRYGSAPVIAIAGLAACVLWWRPIRARPWPALATAAAFAGLLVPHVVQSLHRTGTVLGILRASSEVPRRAYWGEGLVTYVTSNPLTYHGVLVAPVLVAAIFGLARLRHRAAWFLAAVALGQLVVIGVQSHAQPRYVFIAIALLVVLGVARLRDVARPRAPRAALAAVAAAWLGAAITVASIHHRVGRKRASITTAAATLRGHRTLPACVVIAGTGPQLTWYSGCAAIPPGWDDPRLVDPRLDRFLVATPYAALDGTAYAAARGLRATELPVAATDTRVWAMR